MARFIQGTLLFFLVIFFCKCIKDPNEDEKYKRPDWLAGKVYTQLKANPDLSTFTRCVELTGYDSIIDVSGSYTVFAPNNDAFLIYFQNHPEYSSVEEIPLDELRKIVKYHVLQNPWSKIQLRSLDVFGWIDTLDIENNEPKGYKRETLLLEKDNFLGVRKVLIKDLNVERVIIIDTLETSWRRKISVDSRKYAPVFYKEYFSIYDLNLNDYEFYFERSFENPDDIYYVNGRIIGNEIFAENGFVYNIDRVVEPLENAYQILNNRSGSESYKLFLSMADLYPEFRYNNEKTMNQPGAEQGLEVDSLFDLTYPDLTFNIYNEKTKAPSGTMGLPSNVTIRYQHGLIAPTDEAINEFISQYIAIPGGWTTLEDSPDHIKRIIVNTHMCISPIYKSNLDNGFLNGELDLVKLDLSTIVQKQYGSNCTFLGVDKVIVPRAFISVTGPVYLQKGYSKAMYAIEQAGLLPALKRENENYLFYVESDRNTSLDSSLVYDSKLQRFSLWQITGSSRREYRLTSNDLRTLLMNQVGTQKPAGNSRKEFIKNLAGNYLIINNETTEVTGTAPTTQGYKGIPVTNYPNQISADADNGITFDVADWFNFSATSLFLKISTEYPDFHRLLQKAGLSLDREYRYSFISENDNYTVFVPTSAALNDYKTVIDALSINDLKKFLLLHFVQGELIFTDGNKPSGYYETARVDEKSTAYSTVFTQLYVETDFDIINIRDQTGGIYLTVYESESSNMLTGRNLGTGNETFPTVINNGVIHEIDKVLVFNDVDVR